MPVLEGIVIKDPFFPIGKWIFQWISACKYIFNIGFTIDRLGAGVDLGFIFQSHPRLWISFFGKVSSVLPTNMVVIGNRHATFTTPFGGNQYNTVGGPGPVNGC